MLTAAAVCFVLHGLVAMVDGAYFHLYKYKLYARPDSVTEHFTHSLRAATMTASAYIFFVVSAAGWLLWIGIGIIAIDLIIETWDVLIERASRADLGGLSSAEYLSHAHAIFLYAAAYSMVLASKPRAAFSFDAPATIGSNPQWIQLIGWVVVVGAGISTVQHFWLLQPKYRESTTA